MAVTHCQNNSRVTGVKTLSTNKQPGKKMVILLECVIAKPLAPQAEAIKAQKGKKQSR